MQWNSSPPPALRGCGHALEQELAAIAWAVTLGGRNETRRSLLSIITADASGAAGVSQQT